MNTSDQLDLFEDQTQYSTSFKQLEIEYIKDFFNKNESDILFNLLKKDIEWSYQIYTDFNRKNNCQKDK